VIAKAFSFREEFPCPFDEYSTYGAKSAIQRAANWPCGPQGQAGYAPGGHKAGRSVRVRHGARSVLALCAAGPERRDDPGPAAHRPEGCGSLPGGRVHPATSVTVGCLRRELGSVPIAPARRAHPFASQCGRSRERTQPRPVVAAAEKTGECGRRRRLAELERQPLRPGAVSYAALWGVCRVWRLWPSLETSHYVELSHVMRVFSFRLVQSFQESHLTSRDGRPPAAARTPVASRFPYFTGIAPSAHFSYRGVKSLPVAQNLHAS
jgi:hypothetical protein